MDYDAIVIGAGAAGLMTAIHAAERGRNVLLLEKGRKPGVKILMSGGTRCNITHDCDVRGIITAFGPNGKFLHSALAAFTPEDAVAFFNAEGVATKIEDTGKIFPVSDRAIDVLDALLQRLKRSGATLTLAEPVTNIEAILPSLPFREGLGEGSLSPHDDPANGSDPPPPLPKREGSKTNTGFRVTTALRQLTAEHVVITTGGKSFPGCGTTGDGYGFAAAFGHSIVPTTPALVPLKIDAPWVTELKGVTLHVGLRVLDAGKVLSARAGSMLFAHFGLTGPAPLDVSRAVSGHPKPRSLTLEIDFLPGEAEAALDEFLRIETAAAGKQLLASVLSRKLTRRVADMMIVYCGLPVDRTAAALAKVDRQKLAAAMKRLTVPLAGTLGFEKAEVTAGGVSLNEVDSRTMQSKLQPGLFLAGEVLDLDGWIGGYNFQSAWSTGWLAGRHV